MTLSLKTLGRSSCFNFLSCVVIAFGIESQEIMDVQSQLLFIGSPARHLNYGGRTRKGSRTGKDKPAHPKVSLSRSELHPIS